jgi:type IV pilus assembly protein PilC
MRRKVKKAVTYPVFTLVVMVGVVIFMMTSVVPQLKTFLEAQGQELPGYTKALLSTSEFFQNYWYVVIGIPVAWVFLLKTLKRTSQKFLLKWDGFKLKWPVLGPTIRKMDLAKFTRFFGVMYTSGIDILECLKISQQVVRNTVLVDCMNTVMKSVSEGSSITAALRRSGQFPSLVVRMFKVGEDSGNMKEALENINFFYDREVNDTVDALVASIKPMLTIVLGIILVWIAAAMFGPIYGTIAKMQSQL